MKRKNLWSERALRRGFLIIKPLHCAAGGARASGRHILKSEALSDIAWTPYRNGSRSGPSDRTEGDRMDELLRARDVARILGVAEPTVYSFSKKGILPHVLIGSSVRFLPEDVQALIDAGRRTGGATARPGGGRPKKVRHG